MSRIRSRDTKPELMVRSMLHAHGFRFRKNVKELPGSPDIVLPKYRTVIFIHGCFWHGHAGCKYYTVPKTNTDFWVSKVSRNRKRDDDVFRELEGLQWNVIIVWECSLKTQSLDDTINHLIDSIRQNGDLWERQTSERRSILEGYKTLRKEHKAKAMSVMPVLPSSIRKLSIECSNISE